MSFLQETLAEGKLMLSAGGCVAGWGKPACTARPEPPSLRVNSGTTSRPGSACAFVVADELTPMHRACMFSSSRLRNHLSPARPRRSPVLVKRTCHS